MALIISHNQRPWLVTSCRPRLSSFISLSLFVPHNQRQWLTSSVTTRCYLSHLSQPQAAVVIIALSYLSCLVALGLIIASFHHLSHVALLGLIVTSSLALRDHGLSSLASHGSHHLSGRCESHFTSGCQSTGIQSHIACPGILLCFTLRYPLPHPTPPCTPATHVLA